MEALQTACDAIDVFMKDNPSEMPGSKKRPIAFAQWLARFGRKNFKVAEELERPFEKEERLLRFIRKRGLTREQGEEIWNEAEADSKVERSETGYRGQLRLWPTANEQFPEEFPMCKDALASSSVDVKRMNEVVEATTVEHE